MTEPMTQDQFDNLWFLLKEDKAAVQLAVDLLFLSHLVDDLVDRDVERTVADIKLAFRKLFVDLPLNPFYQAYYGPLSTLIATAYMTWLDSTILEYGDRKDCFIAYQLRNDLLRVIHHMIFLIGGHEWIEEHGPEFWRTWGASEAKWTEFLSEVGHDV